MDIQRILLILGLAGTAYFLILAWNQDYGQGAEPSPETEDRVVESLPRTQDPAPANPGNDDAGIPQLDEEAIPDRAREAPESRSLVTVRTDVLDVKIDPLGGDIVSVALPAYPASLKTPDIPYLLIDPQHAYVAQSGLVGPNGTDKSDLRPTYRSERSAYTLREGEDEIRVTLRHTQPGARNTSVDILKHFIFHPGDYLIGVEYEVINNSQEDWRGALFAQIKRDSQDPASESGNSMGLQPYVGGATRSAEDLYRKLEFEDLEDEGYKQVRDQGYMAMVQHYFVSAWVPENQTESTFQARKLKGRDIYIFGFVTQAVSVPAGSIGQLSALFYVGPKDQYRLREIAEGLDLTVDYGFLWWLAQPLFFLLNQLHSVFANWGVAIIFLTVIVKMLLYPLSAAGLKSMAKMRKLQPEMQRLKERFGDDRQKFTQATMELYKKEGANPLGGCFPILLQMPVFLALYWTLMESVELRQAPFMLWIKDLSAMDPLFILPILMGISMYLMQRLQPEPPDPLQARVLKLMPIMFTFFFLWFPSGLVLYWLVNNVISILQQWYVARQVEKAG